MKKRKIPLQVSLWLFLLGFSWGVTVGGSIAISSILGWVFFAFGIVMSLFFFQWKWKQIINEYIEMREENAKA